MANHAGRGRAYSFDSDGGRGQYEASSNRVLVHETGFSEIDWPKCRYPHLRPLRLRPGTSRGGRLRIRILGNALLTCMSLSIPTTRVPSFANHLTVSEPINLADPVTMTVPI